MPYSEDFLSYFVKAQTKAQVVSLPHPPDNLGTVNVQNDDHCSYRVTEPLPFLGAVPQAPSLHSKPEMISWKLGGGESEPIFTFDQ